MTLWGGRFSSRLNEQACELNTSLPVDQRMAIQDVDGSLAWAEAIHRAGILSAEEYASVSAGLTTIRDEFLSGHFSFTPSDEDIHTAVVGSMCGVPQPTRSSTTRRRVATSTPELGASLLRRGARPGGGAGDRTRQGPQGALARWQV